tara:strand:+ start:300 stop:656 length:357 start_codon:yes stop_codon:yes gene_type:complete
MIFSLSLKDPHILVIESLKEKYSVSSNEEVIKMCINTAIKLNKNDAIFGTQREKCSGGCYGSSPHFKVALDIEDFGKLKAIHKEYDFDNYNTEEEAVSKVIRCIINFIEDEPDLISIN